MPSAKVRPAFAIGSGAVCFAILIIIDQLTKRWAFLRLSGRAPLILIRKVFEFYYLENQGAAFGILQGRSTLFFVVTIVISAIIAYAYVRLPFTRRYRILRVFLVFIAAGATGNFIDRAFRGYVIDFFYFYGIHFPVFNVADICVTCATILLIITILFFLKEDDFTEIFHRLAFMNRSSGEDEEQTTANSAR